jgi:signal transduction histidine kinase
MKPAWGIRGVLIVTMIVTLAPFIVLEAYRGAADVQQRRGMLDRQAQNQAIEAARVTQDFVARSGRYAAGLAGSPEVRSLDPVGSQGLFDSVQSENPNYEGVFLLDTQGTVVASARSNLDAADLIRTPYVSKALAAPELTISDVVPIAESGHSVVVLAHRVLGVDGEPRGVMGIALNLSRLSDVIGYVRLPVGSVILLVQPDGIAIASSANPELWVGQKLAGFARPQRDGSSSQPVTTLTTTGDHLRRVLAYDPVDGTPWTMVAAIPQADVDSAVRQSLTRVSEEAALAALATVLLAWFMLRRIVDPIRVLSDGAVAFATGMLERRIALRRKDELGALADALNQMAAGLERRLDEAAAHASALENLNRMQTEFVATASHELKTPVTAVRTYAEALLRPDIDDPEIRRKCLAGIDLSSQRLGRLARTLLDVSRIESGSVPMTFEQVDVAALASRALAQVAPTDDHPVVVAAPHGPASVWADADRLEDVLANLIDNAIKFSPPSSTVTVDLRQEDNELVVAVRDLGCGIPRGELPRVFDRFYQVQQGMDRHAGGSGLGLYIAKAYIETMGGRIWAESSPGAGSTFSFALSLAPARERVGQEFEGHAIASPVAAGRR